MVVKKKKFVVEPRPVVRDARAGASGAKDPASGAGRSRLWLVPVVMALVLLGVGAFLVWDARYLASLKFDMVREARVIPQGHDRGQATGLANVSGDGQGHLFILESQSGNPVRLQRFDQQNSPDTLVYQSKGRGEDLADAVDVDCDGRGLVYVLLKDGRVQILSNDLKYLRTLQTGIVGASAASVNSAGRVYVADLGDNKVVYFNAAGKREGEFGAPGQAEFSLVSPVLLRVASNDEVVVVESTATGLRGRIFTKALALRKTFLVDKIKSTPWVRMGINGQRKIFFNDQSGSLGIVCWDLDTGRFFGESQSTKDGVQFVSPGCIGADRFTPDVYVHTIPGLIKCALPPPDDAKGSK